MKDPNNRRYIGRPLLKSSTNSVRMFIEWFKSLVWLHKMADLHLISTWRNPLNLWEALSLTEDQISTFLSINFLYSSGKAKAKNPMKAWTKIFVGFLFFFFKSSTGRNPQSSLCISRRLEISLLFNWSLYQILTEYLLWAKYLRISRSMIGSLLSQNSMGQHKIICSDKVPL